MVLLDRAVELDVYSGLFIKNHQRHGPLILNLEVSACSNDFKWLLAS